MCLLDTHIWIWWITRSERLSKAELRKLDKLSKQGGISISSISLWEMANLVSLNRITPNMPLREWLEVATDPLFVKVIPITADISAEISVLPDSLHRDPADRLIIATSRVLQIPLFTFDRKIIQSGLVEVIK